MTFIYIWTNGIAPLDLELVDAVQPQGEESEAGEEDQHLDWPQDQLLRDPTEQSGDNAELGVVVLLGLLPPLLPLLLLSVPGADQAAAAAVTVVLHPPLVQGQQRYEPGHLQ